jgi:hypothetical protein
MHLSVSFSRNELFFVFERNAFSFLACPILKDKEPTALPIPAPGNSPPLDGMAYNLHNNVWDTNYVLWYPLVHGDESWRTRFLVTFDGSCS